AGADGGGGSGAVAAGRAVDLGGGAEGHRAVRGGEDRRSAARVRGRAVAGLGGAGDPAGRGRGDGEEEGPGKGARAVHEGGGVEGRTAAVDRAVQPGAAGPFGREVPAGGVAVPERAAAESGGSGREAQPRARAGEAGRAEEERGAGE